MTTEIENAHVNSKNIQQSRGVNRASESAHGIGSVYTPAALAEWTGSQLLRYVSDASVLRVLDPACGDGELLAGISRVASGCVEVIGRDIDANAIATASLRLEVPADLSVGDSLFPSTFGDLERKPDAIIVNPPWGRPDSASRQRMLAVGYELAKGQFDLYEVFIERMVRSFPNTPMAFILPDSIFLPEHTRLRRFLLEHATVLFLARLGEGLFPGVYRGTVVLVLRSSVSEGGDVECLRLGRNERTAFLSGDVSLETVRESHSHVVPRTRFTLNPNAEFTLDIRSDETAVDKMLTRNDFEWDKWLVTGRGVEVGKNGMTLRCSNCGEYRVVPKNGPGPDTKCRSCAEAFSGRSPILPIVRPIGEGLDPPWSPMIVGEDVDRYRCKPTREVLMGLPGIRYADAEVLRSPKMLVRKTGIGIRAAVDLSGTMTIQTVYHFVPRDESHVPVLFYLAGLLNSRVMLAFHLRWSGENEWRSHPYVTTRTIKSLPVPTPFQDNYTLTDRALEIATLARRRSGQEMVEKQIEMLVEDLYDLTAMERQWVNDVIDSAQRLRGIAEMQNWGTDGAGQNE